MARWTLDMRDTAANSTNSPRQGTAGISLRALAAALLLSLGACNSPPNTATPESEAAPEKIRVRDLASRTDPALITGSTPSVPANFAEGKDRIPKPPNSTDPVQPHSTETDDPAAPTAPVADRAPVVLPLVAQLLVVPRDDPRLGLALTMLGDLGLDPAQQHLWHKNGCRVGQISRDSLTLFMANLPKALDVSVTKMQATATWAPVTLIDKLRGTQRLRAFDATGQPKVHKFLGGEYQMLVKMLPPPLEGNGPTKIQIMPHHFSVASSIVPRSPEQKILDGVSFEDLLIAHPISVDHIWVITARVTAPVPADSDEGDDKKSAEPKPALTLAAGVAPAQPADAEFPGPKVPTLAQALFTGKRGTKNMQIILLIGLEKR